MVAKKSDEYNAEKDTDLLVDNGGVSDEAMFPLFKAGQSRRIWGRIMQSNLISHNLNGSNLSSYIEIFSLTRSVNYVYKIFKRNFLFRVCFRFIGLIKDKISIKMSR